MRVSRIQKGIGWMTGSVAGWREVEFQEGWIAELAGDAVRKL